jgi:hypothetical protein
MCIYSKVASAGFLQSSAHRGIHREWEMKWIVRLVVVAALLYGGQSAFQQIRLAHERYEIRKEVQAQLNALPVAKRRAAALELYLNFYWSGASLLPSVCRKEGIDLTDYAKAYTDRYAGEHDRVQAAYRSVGGSEQALVAALSASSTTTDALKKGLLRAASLTQGESMVDGCRAILAKKEKVLDRMNFPEAFPYVWGIADVR